MAKRLLFYMLLLFAVLGTANSQVVTTSPLSATDADQTVITFNAALGDAGLAGYTGDVYAHIGVITNLSTSNSDWKYVKAGWTTNLPVCKLTRIATNMYTLTLSSSIRNYFAVPAGEQIKQIALVFRSVDGTKVGKDTGSKDIFISVLPSTLTVQFVSPTGSFFIHKLGTSLDVSAVAYQNTSIDLYDNNNLLSNTLGQTLNYSYVPTSGIHKLLIVATDAGNNTVKDSISFLADDLITPILPLPAGLRQGINYTSETEATLVLFAPYKSSVYVLGDFNNWEPTADFKMNKGTGADTAMYWLSIPNLTKGVEYGFQYLIDNKIKIADPYTNKILDPWDDKYIADIVYPNLKQFPVGKTTDRVSVLQTGQTPYNWQVTNFTAPNSKSLVIYELLIRDFQNTTISTNKQLGYLQQCIDSIDYFKRLGINAIQIMPFSEFEGNISWGYNPNFYFAPDKAYGTAEKYKEFIDLCHQNGIAVIMDMVLNHAFNSCSFAKMYWNDALSRPAANNPWFNQTAPHTCYSWGSDFNHESIYTKALVDSINSFWMSEYKIDGFRFDFTKGFTNTATTCTTGGSPQDNSRIAILERMYDEIRKRNGDAYVIFEHLTDNSEEKILADYGIMLWGNCTYNYDQLTMGQTSSTNISWSSYANRGFTNPNLVPYMESHDEERQMYRNKKYGIVNATTGYSAKVLGNAIRRSAAATSIFMGIPGPKMVWMFGERGYDVSIDSIGRTDPKPPKWDYMLQKDRLYLFDTYSKLIKLKTTEPAFTTTDFSLVDATTVKQLSLNYTNSDVRIISNLSMTQQVCYPKFSKTGTWYDYFGGKLVDVTDVNGGVTLNPGEFKLYSEKEFSGFAITAIDSPELQVSTLTVYPQPFTTTLTFEATGLIKRVDIYTISGQFALGVLANSEQVDINTTSLSKGIYIARVTLQNGTQLMRQVIK